MKVSILGTEYDILKKDTQEDEKLEDRDGYCDSSVKQIVICNLISSRDSKKDLEKVRKNIIRHEIIHAFLYESGLDVNSDWGTDETLVDWIALQFPKLEEAFKATDCL